MKGCAFIMFLTALNPRPIGPCLYTFHTILLNSLCWVSDGLCMCLIKCVLESNHGSIMRLPILAPNKICDMCIVLRARAIGELLTHCAALCKLAVEFISMLFKDSNNACCVITFCTCCHTSRQFLGAPCGAFCHCGRFWLAFLAVFTAHATYPICARVKIDNSKTSIFASIIV